MMSSGPGVWRLVVIGTSVIVFHGCAGLLGTRGRSAGLAGVPAAGTAARPDIQSQRRIADLERQVREREAELATVRAELEKVRAQPGSAPLAREVLHQHQTGPEGAVSASAEQLARELAKERSERQALLQELERLREEVSSPFVEMRVPESDYLALKQELVELRRQLRRQEEEQQRLAARLPALPPAPTAGSDNPALGETRNEEPVQLALEVERELAASRIRMAELESALEAARREGDKSRALAAENDALKAQLAEERRRAEALEAKLKVAARVTELIFRMRSQGKPGTPSPPAAGPED